MPVFFASLAQKAKRKLRLFDRRKPKPLFTGLGAKHHPGAAQARHKIRRKTQVRRGAKFFRRASLTSQDIFGKTLFCPPGENREAAGATRTAVTEYAL
jgi:hypothetical protein